jgi:hypothetical protein
VFGWANGTTDFVRSSISLTGLVLWSRMMAGFPWCFGVISLESVSTYISARRAAEAEPTTAFARGDGAEPRLLSCRSDYKAVGLTRWAGCQAAVQRRASSTSRENSRLSATNRPLAQVGRLLLRNDRDIEPDQLMLR